MNAGADPDVGRAGDADALLDGSPYVSYLYAYPHKTAYRPLRPVEPLGPLWAGERRDALHLYLHVPFCEMRCGFCNLFTRPMPAAAATDDDLVRAYLDALERQGRAVRRALDEGGDFGFARVAIGGGTPTFLDERGLERVLDVAERNLGAALAAVPLSVETSPATATPSRLALLRARGADRVSIGVQSFVDDECRAVSRPQRAADVHRALEAIRAAGVPILNVDLIYGMPGQDAASWAFSLDAALAHRPEELYLYPMYVRPVTTLGRRGAAAARGDGSDGADGADPDGDPRLALYQQGRDRLRDAGYRQVSMRMFRRDDAPAGAGPAYCCQEDGMVGLGCGARSYTRALHYSSEWAVGARGVRDILHAWVQRDEAAFAVADHGFRLDAGEQRRRWVIMSLLSDEGLDPAAYARRFGGAPEDDLPELAALVPRALASVDERGVLRLTARGVARADAIGPWLGSPRVRTLMEGFALR